MPKTLDHPIIPSTTITVTESGKSQNHKLPNTATPYKTTITISTTLTLNLKTKTPLIGDLELLSVVTQYRYAMIITTKNANLRPVINTMPNKDLKTMESPLKSKLISRYNLAINVKTIKVICRNKILGYLLRVAIKILVGHTPLELGRYPKKEW